MERGDGGAALANPEYPTQTDIEDPVQPFHWLDPSTALFSTSQFPHADQALWVQGTTWVSDQLVQWRQGPFDADRDVLVLLPGELTIPSQPLLIEVRVVATDSTGVVQRVWHLPKLVRSPNGTHRPLRERRPVIDLSDPSHITVTVDL